MKVQLSPVCLNEKSFNVALLHKALAALKLPVDDNEVSQGVAGKDTLSKSRHLMEQLNVSVNDNATLLDENTALTMAKAMADRGLVSTSRSFSVSGAIKKANGLPAKRQRLIVLDLDLLGVAVYRSLRNLEDITRNLKGGFEYLGETASDNKGNYSITFYDWQYQRAERLMADVLIFVLDKNEIIAHSRIVNTEDYSDKGFVRDLDIILPGKDKRTEYQALMDPLNIFLKQSSSSLAGIARSSEQLAFTTSELDLDRSNLDIAAMAELLVQERPKLSHELLYGIGRQDISLNWSVLYKNQQEALQTAITRSTDDGIIREFDEYQITRFLAEIQLSAVSHLLDVKDEDDNNGLTDVLSNALPEEPQRVAFLTALRDFKGSDFSKFWEVHLPKQPEFKANPELIPAIQLTQQLTTLSGNHQPLVKMLQREKGIKSAQALIDFTNIDWLNIIKKAGVPEFITGKDESEKQQHYADHLINQLNATFPTQRIAKMVREDSLGIERIDIKNSIGNFFANNPKFCFAHSRVHDFKKEIEAASINANAEEVNAELMKFHRLFQVSITSEMMTFLLKNNLHSAYSIARIPRNNFIKIYGKALGGGKIAAALHQRAAFINDRTESIAMDMKQFSQTATPILAMSNSDLAETETTFKKVLPNYPNLFGSPDLCECQHCRSVYSPAAYFVELLQFLEKSKFSSGEEDSADNKCSPYDYLVGKKKENENGIEIPGRRPDLAELALSCENTNTLIPYIDLVNEVMEFHVANDSLEDYPGENTGDATVDELRANPQHTNSKAYEILKEVKFPFSLPFHQPLTVIRTYSGFLNVSRYEVMQAINPHPDVDSISQAIAAESLHISPEGYAILVDGTSETAKLRDYFGYDNSPGATGELKDLRKVRELMERSGLAYIDLVEIVKTRFINPHQDKLDYIEKIFAGRIGAETIYTWLKKVNTGIEIPASNDTEIKAALESNTPLHELKQWASEHFSDFQQIITLFEPSSSCNLDTTRLRTIQNIYEDSDPETSSIAAESWSKMHRFIRLWRKIGWSIHETDLMLHALGEDNIRPETIEKLELVLLLKKESKLPLNQLAVLWGDIDTYGKQSLYKKLFLNKTVQQIDQAFVADAQGDYLAKEQDDDGSITLSKHQPAILAAFNISAEELAAILDKAIIKDGNDFRLINFDNDFLSLQNLSAIYRYVVLAKALKLRVLDVCKLIGLFEPAAELIPAAKPILFSTPLATYNFYKFAATSKAEKFKPALLDYIFNGVLPVDSKLGLDTSKTMQTAKAIRDGFAIIEQNHPQMANTTLTRELVAAKLSISFQAEIVSRLMDVVGGTAIFVTQTDSNLGIKIPDNLKNKYSYFEGSGKLRCIGVMSDDDRKKLEEVDKNDKFLAAVDALYKAPEVYISDAFTAVFDLPVNSLKINEKLLNRPASDPEVSLEEKFDYIYQRFLPLLKKQLRQDLVATHIANLIGLSEAATALLIADDIEVIISQLSTQGFSASYFENKTWDDPHLPIRIDEVIDFSWRENAPFSEISANEFSVRWESYIAAPARGEYTLTIEVEEKDEAFNLYLDGELVIDKASGDDRTMLEKVVNLNAAQLHLLTLEYAESEGNAGIRLRWKTATNAPGIIPRTVAYPAHIMDGFVERASVLHRAAKFISGFKISEAELKHFITFNQDFGDIRFKGLNAAHWQRIRDYAELRNAVPQAQAFLTDVFALANQTSPQPELTDLEAIILQSTAWNKVNLNSLITHFNLSISDFKNEIAFNQIIAVMRIVEKTGLAAQTIVQWGKAEINFDELNETAQLLKNTVKAKYEDDEWLKLAGGLSDKIRTNQQHALISYLLVQPDIKKAGVKDADGLFEHFLIDVQMGACMDTSRIVQANAAIQLFVNRILLNLEKDISPDAIDIDRWQWMKNYRVWEANRKVFLYPENWLAPEWRNDRSELFKELESHLLQNDITARSVEQGLRNYLMSLNEVANLDVCGMHQENDGDGKLKCLHVFGRTHNMPYKYFYRCRNRFHKWSAWEKVQMDIPGVEDGANSGVHLIPVVWKGRLFLFWPEFMEMSENSGNGTKDMNELAATPVGQQSPTKYWEIRLAWSEYVDGQWSSKQVSKEYLKIHNLSNRQRLVRPSSIRFHPHFDLKENKLVLLVAHHEYYGQCFVIADLHAAIEIHTCEQGGKKLSRFNYENSFAKLRTHNKPLKSSFPNTFLEARKNHTLLRINNQRSLKLDTNTPFFYSEGHRTYFANPIGRGLSTQTPPNHGIAMSRHEGIDDSGNRSDDNGLLALFIQQDGWHEVPPRGGGTWTITDTFHPQAADNFTTNEIADDTECKVIYGKPLEERSRTEYKLEFHTFHHPFSSKFITRLSSGGIAALMGSDTEDYDIQDPLIIDFIESDKGDTFVDEYDPNPGLIRPSKDHLEEHLEKRTYYQENICFDPLGANSLYNWELFFHAPLYIATRLSKNGKYEEAMKWFHYIFNPTTNETARSAEDTNRYWKVRPFKTTPSESLEELFMKLNSDTAGENANNNSAYARNVSEWRDNPFDPHLVASNRPIAYMKHVVINYVENLIDWGDSLFRKFTRESVYEAIQLYVIASHVLGKRPEFVPKRGEIKTETYANLRGRLDDFGNALVELENIFPYTSTVNSESTTSNWLGIGSALYFCIPANDKLLEYWDIVADRLFKIRHCQDLDGVERGLALFAPPIDPAALIQARSQGLSLGSILADLSSPPPIYRFAYLIQKANEFCNDVKALGSAVLAALEKKDGEELSRLRASQETNMLERVTGIRERQVLAAKVNRENLLKVRETTKLRLKHYKELLGDDSDAPPDAPSLDATLTVNGPLPGDTSIPLIETDVDMSLVSSDEGGVKLIPREKEQLSKNEDVKWINATLSGIETLAGIAYAYPRLSGVATPLGVGLSVKSPDWGAVISHMGANAARGVSSFWSAESSQASIMAGYTRRTYDFAFQANLAISEIIQLDKQCISADIQLQIAEKELQNHQQQIENSKQVELFLKDKFTNQELYQWMKEQLFSVYKQSYNLAHDMAKKAEKAYQYELGTETTNFIQYGYWDNSMQGLVAGEKLQLALRQLDKSYLEENRRELELTKSISIVLLNPVALIELRETGKCYVSLPEELFDLDFQGHYFRRIKSVSISIPCVTGPYTTVNCSLRLLKNTVRLNTLPNSEGEYEHNVEEGLLLDDARFRSNNVPVTSIATSSGQNDAGMFEFNFRDERYLPFERAGAISDWMIELSTEKALRQFDYSTISDVIFHLKYTARESSGPFKEMATTHATRFIEKAAEHTDQPFMRMFSMKHEFPTEWHKFLHPESEGVEHALSFTIGKEKFPFFVQDSKVVVGKIDVFAKSAQAVNQIILSYTKDGEDALTSIDKTLSQSDDYGELHYGTLESLGEPDITREMRLSSAANPGEIEDIFLVLHYKLDV